MRIACFSLGSLVRWDKVSVLDMDRALQHLMVIRLAEMLDQLHRITDPSLPPVQIVLQDPNYQTGINNFSKDYATMSSSRMIRTHFSPLIRTLL